MITLLFAVFVYYVVAPLVAIFAVVYVGGLAVKLLFR
jgi:hypothetical protein